VPVVEDEPALSDGLRTALALEGYEVEVARDGVEALNALVTRPVDAIVLDVLMPRLDGIEVCRRLRAARNPVAILMLTARADVDDRIEGLDAGADDYVVKPFTARELVARLRTHLTLARMRADVARQAEEARTEAEAASSAKDLFLATLSHELRQPLSSILGWIRLLQRPDVDGAGRSSIHERLERSVGSLTRLIDDLLDVSSIVTGKMRLSLQIMDLRLPIETALDNVRASADAKSIQLESALDPATPSIVGDADRLQQVVSNLFSNAVKFTPDGGRVSVSLEHDGAWATLRVSDSGRGISAEFMPRLFDRFSQAAAGGRRAAPGLGLGLAISRHLVELHGGTITAESRGEGQGTTFTVILPIPTRQPDAGATPPREETVRSR
jgi:signal transduction histidine kinase